MKSLIQILTENRILVSRLNSRIPNRKFLYTTDVLGKTLTPGDVVFYDDAFWEVKNIHNHSSIELHNDSGSAFANGRQCLKIERDL